MTKPESYVEDGAPTPTKHEEEDLLGRGSNSLAALAERHITPRVLLALFTLMNFVAYFDRGAMSGCLPNVRADSTIAGNGVLPQTQSGAIVSAFMVGFMVTCPLFVGLGGRYSAKQIMVFGLLVWCLACIGTGCSVAYWMILTCRCFVGIGEAAYVGFSVTIIDNIAPPAKRTLWIGCFYSMIPVGTALGMGLGGIIGSHGTIGSIPGWRVAFMIEVLAMLPIVGVITVLPTKYEPVGRKSSPPLSVSVKDEEPTNVVASLNDDPPESRSRFSHSVHVSLWSAIPQLLRNPLYLLLVLGQATYTFVLGAIAVWAIPMLQQGPMQMPQDQSSMFVGGAVAINGLVGSIAGGKIVDRFTGGQKGLHSITVSSACCVCAVVVALPLGLFAIVFADKLSFFAPPFLGGVFFLFCTTAPINAAVLSSVAVELRSYAISFNIFLIHVLGDFPSPIIAGAISDSYSEGCDNFELEGNCTANHNSNHCVWIPKHKLDNAFCANQNQLRYALGIVFAVLVVAIPVWAAACVIAWRRMKSQPAN